jgi:signal transduction histidine kinase
MPVIDSDEHLKEINQELYKRGFELAIRNKTLSLLRELYQTSILILPPPILAERLARTVRAALDFELVGVLSWDENNDILLPLGFAESGRMEKIISLKRFSPKTLTITNVSQRPFLSDVIRRKEIGKSGIMHDVWAGLIPSSVLEEVEATANARSTIVYPLTIGQRPIGVFVIVFNRTYDQLGQFEREAIESLVDIIAIALDKSLLNEQIKAANEKLKELDRQKTEFVSIAAHQLRAPLTAIKGYSSMILEGSFGEISDKVKEAVSRVFESSRRLTNVIEDFLNVTRIELGKMKYDMTEFPLGKLVEQIVIDMKPPIEKRGLTIFFDTDNTGPYIIRADQGKMAQVISNLIDNAIKYTPKGSINVKIARTDKKIHLTVSDTGVGVSPEMLPRLFEKFVRATEAGKVNYIGTGLGLFVVKQIIEAHGGRVWAESDGLGKGSRFTVEL